MIGVNVWCMMHTGKIDLPCLFEQLRQIGFDAVEGLLVPKKRDAFARGVVSTETSFGAFAAEAARHGLKTPSVHVFNILKGRFLPKSSVIRSMKTLHREYGVESFVFSGAFSDASGARKWASYLNELAQAMADSGGRIVYHNHDQELNKVCVNGREMTALDYFMELSGEDIGLQLDIGWAGMGADEVELAKKYAGRIHSLHLKDFTPGSRGIYHNPNVPKERFAAIGTGEIRTQEILDIRDSFPNYHGRIIIDQDFSAGDLLRDLKTGYDNVVAMMNKGE